LNSALRSVEFKIEVSCTPGLDYCFVPFFSVSRGDLLGIANLYWLDGSEIETRWGLGFPHRPDRPWGPPSLLYNGYRAFPGGKLPGSWLWTPTPPVTS